MKTLQIEIQLSNMLIFHFVGNRISLLLIEKKGPPFSFLLDGKNSIFHLFSPKIKRLLAGNPVLFSSGSHQVLIMWDVFVCPVRAWLIFTSKITEKNYEFERRICRKIEMVRVKNVFGDVFWKNIRLRCSSCPLNIVKINDTSLTWLLRAGFYSKKDTLYKTVLKLRGMRVPKILHSTEHLQCNIYDLLIIVREVS